MINFGRLPSTNDYVKEHYKELDNFESIVTTNQTNGRGRSGHTWESEPNKNVALSFLITDNNITKKFNLLSVVAGIVVSEYLTVLGLPDVSIKWPNDVYVGDKKIAGILLEGSIPHYVVIGIGINVNQTNFKDLPAISIKNIIGMKIDPVLVAVDIIDQLKYNIKKLGNDLSEYIEIYHERDYLLNKTISYIYNGESKTGIARGINLDGSYKIETDGQFYNVNTNEINIVRTQNN